MSTRIPALSRIAYLIIILLATLTNLDLDPQLADVGPRLARAFDLTLHMHDAVDAVRNITLFAGLGAVWIVTSPSKHPWRSTWHVTLIGCAVSVMVETLQLFSPIRNASIIDVTTNTVGTFLGAVGVLLAISAIRAMQTRDSFLGIPALLFAVPYGVAVLMETFAPLFRQNYLRNLGGGVAERVGRAWAAMRIDSIRQIPITDIALFFPAGVFAVAAAAEFGVAYQVSWPLVALAGWFACGITEIVHGVNYQPIQLGAIISHGIAITIGAWWAARWLPSFGHRQRGARDVRGVLLAYSTIVMLWSWRPFYPKRHFTEVLEQLTPVHWIPLRALAERVDLFSVTDTVTQLLLFLPLGALLAVWPLRRAGAWRDMLPAFYLAGVLELGKIVVAERFLDVTHILIQVGGTAMGWIIVRCSGFTPYGEVWRPDTVVPPSLSPSGRFHDERVPDTDAVAG